MDTYNYISDTNLCLRVYEGNHDLFLLYHDLFISPHSIKFIFVCLSLMMYLFPPFFYSSSLYHYLSSDPSNKLLKQDLDRCRSIVQSISISSQTLVWPFIHYIGAFAMFSSYFDESSMCHTPLYCYMSGSILERGQFLLDETHKMEMNMEIKQCVRQKMSRTH